MKQIINNYKKVTSGILFYAIVLLTVFSGVVFSSFSWNSEVEPTVVVGDIVTESNVTNPLFNEADLLGYLRTNIKYPKYAKMQRVQGVVVLSFKVGEDGSLSHINVDKGIGYGCDKEAIRVVSKYAKWNTSNAERVKVVLPITFKLRR